MFLECNAMLIHDQSVFFFFTLACFFYKPPHILYIKHDIGIDQYSCTGIKNGKFYLINKVMFYYLPHKLYNISVYTFLFI